MAETNFLTFTKSVDNSRKTLIQAEREAGLNISPTASLDAAVNAVAELAVKSAQNNKHWVRWIDLDATVLKEVYVGNGEDLPETEVPPVANYDPEYLEFVEWVPDEELTNITTNIVCYPQYIVKANSEGRRPTIIKVYLDETTGLNASVYLSTDSGTPSITKAIVDWGDGAVEEFTSGGTKEHTYTSRGLYTIKMIADSSGWYGYYSHTGSKMGVLSVYIGDSTSTASIGYNCSNLKVLMIPESVTDLAQNGFSQNYMLKVLFSKNGDNSSSVIRDWGSYMYAVKYIYLKSLTVVTPISNCYSLIHLNSKGAVSIPVVAYNLESINTKHCSSVTTSASSAYHGLMGIDTFIATPNITTLNISGITDIKKLILPYPINLTVGSNMYRLNYLQMGAVSGNINFAQSYLYSLETLILPSNINYNINIRPISLKRESLINLAVNLKDNSGLTAKTITFTNGNTYGRQYINSIWLDANGIEVPTGSENGMPLTEYIQSKNWTVSFTK